MFHALELPRQSAQLRPESAVWRAQLPARSRSGSRQNCRSALALTVSAAEQNERLCVVQ
jgi:hypothetical protein